MKSQKIVNQKMLLLDCICKLEITNPTFETLYMRNRLDGNGCNQILCSKREQEVMVVHNDHCVSGHKNVLLVAIYIGHYKKE